MALFIGLMSGTSLDGVDAALVDLDGSAGVARPARTSLRTLGFVHEPMPQALAAELLALNRAGDNELHRAALATNALMQVYAQAVHRVCAAARVPPEAVRAIGAHGQTVRHQPGLHDGIGYTLQLVNGALLAEHCAVDVVCDFRSRDVAAGGQGAPLVPAFHAAMFAVPGQATAVLNVGGIANVTLLAADGAVSGFDTGPGNMLMDSWMREQRGQPFDADGALAASGQVDAILLARLLAEPYFAAPAPKSTGRDLFNDAWLNARLGDGVARRAADVMATLLELTARSVADAVRGASASELLVCGGGAENSQLMRRLTALLPHSRVRSTATLGLPTQQIEALAFAWLAAAWVNKMAGNVPAVTGSPGPRVLGAMYPR